MIRGKYTNKYRVMHACRLYTGCLKKNAMEIQQAVVHHKLS
jgi:hypothetical protein